MRTTLFFIFFSSYCFGQQSPEFDNTVKKENFETVMQLKSVTTNEFKTILSLSDNYGQISVDTCMLLAEKALSLVTNNTKPAMRARVLTCQANAFRLKSENEKAFSILLQVEHLAEDLNDDLLMSETSNLQGTAQLGLGNSDKAIEYFLKSAAVFEKIGDDTRLAKEYTNISGVFFDQNDMKKSQEYNTKIIELGEKLNDNIIRTDGAGLRAISWMTEGILYYMANAQDSVNIGNTMDTLYHYFDLSDKEFDRARDLSHKIDDKTLKLSILNNNVALLLNMENYDKAEKLSLEALETAKEIGNNDLIIQSKFNLGSYYRRTGDLSKSLQYGLESLALARKYKIERKIYIANSNLYELYVVQEDWQNALKTQNEMRSYELKVAETDRTNAITEAETKYQTKVKENQILELESTNSKISMQRNGIIGGALLGSLLLFFGFRFLKIKRERNDKMELTKALLFAQEEERKRIARDLHDGVGQSLLLIKKQLGTNQSSIMENQTMITETLEEVRSISRGLHPFQLEKFGLTATINDMIEKVEQSTDIFITKEIDNVDGLLPEGSDIHIFRVVQEAFNNIVKHAKATAAKLDISDKQHNILISIKDNGQGFDHEVKVAKSRSLGLKTMHERIVSIGGTFKITRNPGPGMQIEILIPKK